MQERGPLIVRSPLNPSRLAREEARGQMRPTRQIRAVVFRGLDMVLQPFGLSLRADRHSVWATLLMVFSATRRDS